MNIPTSLQQQLSDKAIALNLTEEYFINALSMLFQNRHLVNAIDNRSEMDDYIYRAIIKTATEKRRRKAEENLYHQDTSLRKEAEKDLALLSRDEIVTDPYYRAILPLLVKVLAHEPILKLHAEEASEIILQLADFKRRHRATSVTEVIVKNCRQELDALDRLENIEQAAFV